MHPTVESPEQRPEHRLKECDGCHRILGKGAMLSLYESQTQEHQIVSTIEKAERLKKELTDKWVVVAANAPELKRFANLTGKVKTVNMSCRALVEFDGPVDIGWYDIDTSYLTVVDSPQPKKTAAHAEAKPTAKTAPAAAKAAPAAGGGSPRDTIRAARAKPAAATATAPATGGSPLDKIRAAGSKPAAAAPSAAPATGGGSPLDKIRAAAKPAVAPVAEPTAAPIAPEEAPKPAAQKTAAPMSGSPMDRIRAMGAAKKE